MARLCPIHFAAGVVRVLPSDKAFSFAYFNSDTECLIGCQAGCQVLVLMAFSSRARFVQFHFSGGQRLATEHAQVRACLSQPSEVVSAQWSQGGETVVDFCEGLFEGD